MTSSWVLIDRLVAEEGVAEQFPVALGKFSFIKIK